MVETSVIMATYKESIECLKQSIESIINQTYNDFEFIIILDNPDNKEHIAFINDYVCKDERIKFYINDKNMGLTNTLNRGLELAEGKYICRMDADDIALPNRFEKQIAFMESNVDIDCAGCWAVEIQEDGSDFFLKRMPQNHDQCLALFRRRDCVIHPSVIFRYTYFEKVPFYPEDTYFGEDTMMWGMGYKAG